MSEAVTFLPDLDKIHPSIRPGRSRSWIQYIKSLKYCLTIAMSPRSDEYLARGWQIDNALAVAGGPLQGMTHQI